MWLFAVCHQLLSLQFLENFSIFLRHLSWWGWCCLQHWKSMWIEVYCGVYVIQNSYHWLCRKQLNGINLVSQVDKWRDACVLCTLLALWHDINDNHCHEHQNNLHQSIVQSAFNWQWRMEILPRMYIVASHVWELTSQNHLLFQIAGAMSQLWFYDGVDKIIQMGFLIWDRQFAAIAK